MVRVLIKFTWAEVLHESQYSLYIHKWMNDCGRKLKNSLLFIAANKQLGNSKKQKMFARKTPLNASLTNSLTRREKKARKAEIFIFHENKEDLAKDLDKSPKSQALLMFYATFVGTGSKNNKSCQQKKTSTHPHTKDWRTKTNTFTLWSAHLHITQEAVRKLYL